MYATLNLPGSQYFRVYGPAGKQECADWIDKTLAKEDYPQNYRPAEIHTNSAIRKWKYQDGSKVVDPTFDYTEEEDWLDEEH